MKKFFLFLFTFFLLLFMVPTSSYAFFELVKSDNNSTIYYIDSDGIRHTFPDFKTYFSWYGNDFSKVFTVSNEFLKDYPLGKNITLRPAKFLVKIQTNPKVYFVEEGGLLRHIDNSDVAESLYGQKWEDKIIDIPEVFFGDYSFGDPLVRVSDFPDSILYKIRGQDTYYWKNNNILQPFSSITAVLQNSFSEKDVIIGTREYFKRPRPIEGKNKEIFNPAPPIAKNSSDCEAKDLKAAFLFVTKGSMDEYEGKTLETLKTEFSKRYSWATKNLSKVDLSWPISNYEDDGYLVFTNEKAQNQVSYETFFSFYEKNPDVFDYLFVFTDFKIFYDKEIAEYITSSNYVGGIGKSQNRGFSDFGSQGKLKGVIMMGDVHNYETSSNRELSNVLNLMLHEISHSWGAYITYIDDEGKHNESLLNKDLIHWSDNVTWTSPLGGSGWQDNLDGTFTSLISQLPDPNMRSFSDFELYLMGLLPHQFVKPFAYFVPENSGDLGNTLRGKAHFVNIDQVIQAHGGRLCYSQ